MKTLSENKCFGGVQGVYSHDSRVTGTEMTFAVFMPPQAEDGPVPCLWYLSGLTCTHENAMTKAGLQAHAAEFGLAVVFPDTSPRGESVANDEAYDLGQGAGFYVNATECPWAPHFQMESYIAGELRDLISEQFAVSVYHGITGHSMGGHGALTLAMKYPGQYQSVSAFAPIGHPAASEWGRKQFEAYLGKDETAWAGHDAALLLKEKGWAGDILIDQGADDQFLELLRADALSAALVETKTSHAYRLHHGYDHSYYFVSTFARDHVSWHAERLIG
ncbi:S-formylglutathione hydrolase [Roseibium denhamense]|uniref:S-formylglutathione hydrolase n=1 Tax=Roseibium denhamense TaxID=76305 RepID=A0ABY1NRC4_9HYPH|nr:S-formylglutathione hydrolase [Roseibium denhamense]MTI08062.1 S-formylglutathione hydrolase [Roseibium denhamense]SMP15997.1 S-formylglutathione hydrolase [Roseibium denhamense]